MIGLQPGCDANFTRHAKLSTDGSAYGQHTDQFGGGFGGFHAAIDCLSVDSNEAGVRGVITHGAIHDLEGVAFLCTDQPDVDLFDMLQGEVKVKQEM